MNGPAQAIFLRRLAAIRDGRPRAPTARRLRPRVRGSGLRPARDRRDPGPGRLSALRLRRRCGLRRNLRRRPVDLAGPSERRAPRHPQHACLRRRAGASPRFSRASRDRLRHALRRNTVARSRLNIRYHYDLGTDFYSLFLDPSLTYSCGIFETPETSLAEAQLAKLDRIARALELAPGDRVIEIGSGWGAFAIHAANRYGCRVTTTTISRSQYDYVRERLAREGASGRVELLFEDYRRLSGRYDKAVSIEMFEAVGLSFYDAYFSTVDRLLLPGGAMLLQTIWMNEERFPRYHSQPDFIQRHIFPGSELASIGEIRRSARARHVALRRGPGGDRPALRPDARGVAAELPRPPRACARSRASPRPSSACGTTTSATARALSRNATSATRRSSSRRPARRPRPRRRIRIAAPRADLEKRRA